MDGRDLTYIASSVAPAVAGYFQATVHRDVQQQTLRSQEAEGDKNREHQMKLAQMTFEHQEKMAASRQPQVVVNQQYVTVNQFGGREATGQFPGAGNRLGGTSVPSITYSSGSRRMQNK